MTKRVHIKTWGCQMNVYDSQRMADLLAIQGYQPTDQAEDADLIILNTCHIREKAAEKLYSELGRLKPLKAQRAGRLIAVAGCVAQAEGAEILARAPVVDLVLGPQTYHHLGDLVAEVERAGTKLVRTEFPPEVKFDHLPEERAGTPPSAAAFLAVQEGCDKFCTFCVVPYTRGAEYSRPAADVLAEAARLAQTGTIELTLLGQNVNAWAGAAPAGQEGTWSLARLLDALAHIPGLQRLRYTTSHPRDMAPDLIAAHRDNPALMPYLHLPIQAGSDRILQAMNRKHRAADYLRLVDRLRAARPDLALSGDFIVGFPGETRADFAETLRVVTEVGYAQAYSFKYSARPGTPAANHADQIDEAEKADRLAALQQLLGAQQRAFNQGFVGRTVLVLIERPGRRPGQIKGRTPHNQSLFAAGDASLIGRILPAQVVAAHDHALEGVLVSAQSPAKVA